MDAIELLTRDHRNVQELLSQLESLESVEERRELFEKIRAELETHEQIEEQLFYPALKEHSEAREIVLEGMEEHHVVDVILTELDHLEFSDDRWPAKAKVMKENIEHHIQEEENEMFSKAKSLLSPEMLAELGREMELKKDELTKLLA